MSAAEALAKLTEHELDAVEGLIMLSQSTQGYTQPEINAIRGLVKMSRATSDQNHEADPDTIVVVLESETATPAKLPDLGKKATTNSNQTARTSTTRKKAESKAAEESSKTKSSKKIPMAATGTRGKAVKLQAPRGNPRRKVDFDAFRDSDDSE